MDTSSKTSPSRTEPEIFNLVKNALASRDRDDLDDAAATVADALKAAPGNFEALMAGASIFMRRGDIEGAITCYRKLAELAPDAPRLAFEIVRLLVLMGDIKQGSEELEKALGKWPSDPSLRGFALMSGFKSQEELLPMPAGGDDRARAAQLREQQFLHIQATAPRDHELLRTLVTDNKFRDVIVAEAPNAKTCVLVFTGLNDVVSMPLPIFDRYMAAYNVTAIYLKDFQRLTYLKGIVSLGKDFDTTIVALRELCYCFKVSRLCTLGFSAGGSAAVRYGVVLGARSIVSICGTSYNKKNDTLKLSGSYRMVKERASARLSSDDLDLKEFLSKKSHVSKIEWLYPELEPRDAAHANYLSEVKGVTLHPISGCDDHYLPRWLALRNDLRGALINYLDLELPNLASR